MSKKYPKYKPSNIEWIGDIPEHWEIKVLKRLAKICNGQDHKKVWDANGQFPIIGTGGTFGYTDSYLHQGPSVILGRKGTIDKPQYMEAPFWSVDTAYYTEIFPSTNPRYFYYLCTTINFELYKYGSAVPSMSQEVLNQIPFSVTNALEEQMEIANYLDKKTQEIDQLIEDKKQLIQLLEEEKATIISQLITKGVDSNAKMCDSGIEWIGEIPKHWVTKKLKYVLSDKLKYGANESADEENRENPRYIRITDFGKNGKLKKDTFKSLPPEKANEYLLKEGDILFARSGATVGKTFQFKNYNGIACFAGYLIKASPNPELILSDYLYLFTKTSNYEQWKNSIFNQATIQNIGADKYAYLDITIPKVEEQKVIIDHIHKESDRIDSKIKKTKKLIDLLIEYRSALISEVVTGKVKVID